jgi:hypothetical protein
LQLNVGVRLHTGISLMGEGEVDELAGAASDILGSFIRIHDDIRSPGALRMLRRSLPIPGFFEPIPFAAHSRTLTDLLVQLDHVRVRAGARASSPDSTSSRRVFFDELQAYCSALADSISRLMGICDDLAEKAEGGGGPRLADYQRSIEEYDRSRENCVRLGLRLNEALAAVPRDA